MYDACPKYGTDYDFIPLSISTGLRISDVRDRPIGFSFGLAAVGTAPSTGGSGTEAGCSGISSNIPWASGFNSSIMS